jgi:V8-like Glu-specific endopeptidase
MRLGLLLLIITFNIQSQAIIFGTDNRKDVIFDTFKNRQLAPAIAMSVGNNFAIPQTENKFSLDFHLASDSFNVGLCPEERFSKQYANWLNCTGFLVTEDVMVTAGHCIVFNHSSVQPALVEDGNTTMCRDFSWVFDFKATHTGQVPIMNYDTQQQIAGCQKVIYAHITPDQLKSDGVAIGEYGLDYSIIRLDRPLLNRKPLRLAEGGTRVGEPVSAVTYPSGLPLKVASHARVLQNQFENYFTTNLDISSGSSGGPVFNYKNEVIGIVVRASPVEDYIWDKKRDCATSYVCQTIGAGTCNEKNGEGGYPLGTHVHKIEPILKKLRELGLLKTDRLEKQKEML